MEFREGEFMSQQILATISLPDDFIQLLAQEVVNRLSLSIPQNTPDRYLNIGEAADYCGVSRSTFDGWRKKEKIEFGKPTGGSIYFKVSDLDKFMTNK